MHKRVFIFLGIICLIILIVISLQSCTKPRLIEPPSINLYLSADNKVISLGLEEYITGCVAAEMPASFELEALKAQAVCARTYAIRKILDQHLYPQGADLSDDITTCQAYITETEFYKRHPHNSDQLYGKIKKVVAETEGVVIFYKNKPIDALYHSTCGGQTASGKDSFGQEVAYLTMQKCPYCKESSYYRTEQVFSYGEFSKLMGISLNSNMNIIITNNSSGRSSTVTIGNNTITTNIIRQKLNLPSNWLNISLKKNNLVIKNRGYGHGAGLCQYGANGLAKDGRDYKEIIRYYYTGVKLYKIGE